MGRCHFLERRRFCSLFSISYNVFLAPKFQESFYMLQFELDFPNEYIVSVEGCYDKVFGFEAEVVTMVKFKTNKRTTPPFGMDGGIPFVFEMKDHKIVGFHGKSGDYVHQVGVHVSPISKS